MKGFLRIMEFVRIHPGQDLSQVISVLNESHDTVAKMFGFTIETNPTNAAFIDECHLRAQIIKGIELFLLTADGTGIGCIAIEKSAKEIDTYYIEKVSILPAYRHQGYGLKMMEFATEKIRMYGGKWVSIALIDSHEVLKAWYTKQGFKITCIKEFPQLPFKVCFMRKEV
jgi:diamine N-acetyltransferase